MLDTSTFAEASDFACATADKRCAMDERREKMDDRRLKTEKDEWINMVEIFGLTSFGGEDIMQYKYKQRMMTKHSGYS